jgi:DNA polymerase-3 subunit delta'
VILIGHKKQWEFLRKKFESDQLSHAYLFSGTDGIGKEKFAIELIKLLNCKGSDKPCGKCANCQTIEKNNFPDLLIVRSVNSTSSIKNKKDSQEIDVGQIREAQNFLSYKSYYGSFKSVIVEDAERMNVEAQSCFLKTLEEPKGKTLIILISSTPDMLLPTITSRCQAIKFTRPKDLPENSEKVNKNQEILKDLMAVINLDLSDKFKYVKSLDFEEQDVREIIEVMQRYLRSLLLAETGIDSLKEPAYAKGSGVAKKYSVQKIKDILNLIEDISNRLLFTNASPKLALEILLMEF